MSGKALGHLCLTIGTSEYHRVMIYLSNSYELAFRASSLDGQNQPAWFYKSKSILPQPLIVSLHTWSGGFDQKDTLSWEAIRKDFNYIHPHFRGPNNIPQAEGGKQAKAGHNRSAISLLKELVVIWYMYFGTNGYLYGKLFQLRLKA